ARLHAERGDNDADPTAVAEKPIAYDRYRLRTSVRRDLGGWSLEPRAEYLRHDYDDGMRLNGTVIEQDARDRHDYTGGARLTYRPDKIFSFYTDAEFTGREYDMDTGGDRDSDGGSY